MKIKDKVVVGFWHNRDGNNRLIPNIPLMSIKSFIGNCKEYQLYSYQQFDNVPDGCKLIDAREIMPEDQLFIHKSGSLAVFPDYFRIHLLLKNHDAIWSDTDNILIKDCFDNDVVVAKQDGRIQSSFLYFGNSSIGDEIRKCIKQFVDDPTRFRHYDSDQMRRFKFKGLLHKMRMSNNENFRPQLEWQMAGSELYTSIFRYLNIMDLSYDYYKYFNPYKYTVQRELYIDDIKTIDVSKFKDVGVLILSTDLLRREPDICQNFNSNSFIANLLKKYKMQSL